MDDSQFVMLKLSNGNYLRFQVDTGAQCNVVPLDLYKKSTGLYFSSLLHKISQFLKFDFCDNGKVCSDDRRCIFSNLTGLDALNQIVLDLSTLIDYCAHYK